jgi:hypothetical protein
MSDLELLREFRSEVSAPDEHVVAQARRDMFNEAGSTRAGFFRRRRSRGHLESRRLPARARIALGLAISAALAVAVLALLPGGHPGGAESAAAAVLQRAANTAASHGAVSAPKPGQYLYTKTKSLGEDTVVPDFGPNNHQYFSVLITRVQETWVGTDESGRQLTTTGKATLPTDQDRSVWIAAGRPDLGGNQTYGGLFKPGELYYRDLSKLPADTEKLRTLIEGRKVEGGPPGDAETFTIIGDLLHETYAPPALRAALYRIASELPGVQLIGDIKDPMGRTGVAVGYPGGGFLHELIFDPNTAALLAQTAVVTDPARAHTTVSVGTTVSWDAYLASGITDSTNDRP